MRMTKTTLGAFNMLGEGAVVGIYKNEISRDVVNRMVVRYIETVDNTAACKVFVKENETSVAYY